MKYKQTLTSATLLAGLFGVCSPSFSQSSAQDDFKVALAARQVGDHTTAYEFSAKSVAKQPWVAAHHAVSIYAASQSGRFSKKQCSKEALSEIEANDPELKDVYKACGFALKGLSDGQAALLAYYQAQKLDPKDKDTAEAINVLEKIELETQAKTQARQVRLMLAQLKGGQALSDEQVQWVIASNVELSDKVLLLSSAKRHTEAVTIALENPNSALKPYGQRSLGQSYAALGQHSRAQAIYESLMTRDDVEIEVLSELFYVYTDSHQYGKAQKYLDYVRTRFEGNARVKDVCVRLQAKLMAWSGKADQAVSVVAENLSTEAAAMVTAQLLAGERPRRAIKGYENQLTQSPNNPYIKLDKARTHIQLRELDEAQREITEVRQNSGAQVSPSLVKKSQQALDNSRKPALGTSLQVQEEQGNKGSKTITSNTYAYMNSSSGLVEGTVDVGTVREEIADSGAKGYETLSVSGNAKFRYAEVSAGLTTDSERSKLSPIVGFAVENDYVRGSMSIRTNNQATGARARAAGVSSDVFSASLSLKPTSRLTIQASGSFEKLSDENRRERVSLTTLYQVYSTVDSRVFAYGTSSLTHNSSQAVVYYSPLRLKSNVAGLKASKDFNVEQKRITLGVDAYVGRQDEIRFADAVVGGATLSLDFASESGLGLSVYLGADQRVYDGEQVLDVKGGLNVSGRF